MATTTRVYKVKPKADGGEKARLVRASHPAHALRHVADGEYQVEVASQDDLITMLQSGCPIEALRSEQQELPTD